MDINEIKKRIGKNSDFDYNKEYFGFDMSRTHGDLEEISKRTNLSVLEKFSDILNPKIVIKDLDCWEGEMFFKNTQEEKLYECLDDYHQKFGGWTMEKIIEWILDIGLKIIKIDQISNSPPKIISKEERYKALRRQKWKCNFCHTTLKFNKFSDWNEVVAHIDHIHPYTKRESYTNGIENINESANLQALYPECNLKKSMKEIN